MKCLYYFLILLAGLAGLGSCKKFLDTKSTDFNTPPNFYTTADQLEQGLNASYSNLMVPALYAQQIGFNFDCNNDELLTNQGSSQDVRGLRWNFDPTNGSIGQRWQYLYIGVTNVNLLIDNINKPVMDASARDIILGQALFLRGLYYFLLTSNYGDVPLILHQLAITEVDISATAQKDVYIQVEADLKQAETLLQNYSSKALGYNDVATITAVQALLARVYMYWAGYPQNNTAKYNDALTYCNKVIGSGMHALNPDYKQIFINLCQDKYDVQENIFEVGSYGLAPGVAGKVGNDIGNFVGINSTIAAGDTSSYAAVGWVQPTAYLFNAYPQNPASSISPKASFDLRRDWNCAGFTYANGPRRKVLRSNIWQFMAGKIRREYCTPTIKNGSGGAAAGAYGINFPVIRYADVLLMQAEAENYVNGPTATAYTAINQVRRRGWGILYGNVVKSIAVTNGGSGYSAATPPVVTISGGGGSGATAIPVVSSAGVITNITIVSPGTLTVTGPYYTSAPNISIAPPLAGTQATAAATITNSTDADLAAGLNKVDFQLAIRDERMKELCFEAQRRFDLVRWGNFYGDIQNFAAYAVANGAATGNANGYQGLLNLSPRCVLLPKPAYELNLNHALTQNPGW